jgi:hypothetical protein
MIKLKIAYRLELFTTKFTKWLEIYFGFEYDTFFQKSQFCVKEEFIYLKNNKKKPYN